ncbi:MAG TPA: hypothetical protein VKB85_09115 [Propionibacteriaceae bacterium]|nr:hypothetical protein [Propionibacteriaceae bacterium]
MLAASRGPGWRILRAASAAVWPYLGFVASLVLPHHTGSWGYVGGIAGILVGFGLPSSHGGESSSEGPEL